MTNVKRCRACRAADMFQATSTQNLTVKGVDVTVHGLRHWECPECSAQVETPDQIDFNAVLVREAFLRERAAHKRQRWRAKKKLNVTTKGNDHDTAY